MNEALAIRIARLMHWQRQLTNARGALLQATKREDEQLMLLLVMEAQRAEAEREAAILQVGAAAGSEL
jgi:hypothetical protein